MGGAEADLGPYPENIDEEAFWGEILEMLYVKGLRLIAWPITMAWEFTKATIERLDEFVQASGPTQSSKE